jgi:soluble lytic murein transglycosylase-like protein
MRRAYSPVNPSAADTGHEMSNRELLLLLGLAGAGYWLYTQQSSDSNAPPPDDATSFMNNPVAAITEMVTPWKSAGQAATWLPILAVAENAYGIPTDLLARIAYQESRFREDIIRGDTPSTAGALGMMQMMPQYFQSVNRPRPYSDQDVTDQVNEAAGYLARNYAQFGNWTLAVAAYNAGATAVKKYAPNLPPFTETQNYVAQISADLPGIV